MKAVKARGAIASSSGARSSPFGFKKNNTFLGRRRETNWFAGEKLDRASASAGALAGATPLALGSGRRAGERAGRRACLQPPCSSSGSVGSGASKMETPGGVVLKAKDIDKDNFASFGQVISPQDDGKHFDSTDAQLVLDQGTPRFYIMRLDKRGMAFQTIVHHAKVTQCLGSTQGGSWYIAVAKKDVKKPSGDNMQAFRIPPGVFIKLHCGTWHAGPLFDTPTQMDFANLELSDTNVTDFNCYELEGEYSIQA